VLFAAITLTAFCSFVFSRFYCHYTLFLKFDAGSSWYQIFRYLTAFRRHWELNAFFKANLLVKSSIIFNSFLVLTHAMCGAEPQAEHPSERSERHNAFVRSITNL